MRVRKTEVVPIECVVRGYLAGSAWSEYSKNGCVCGATGGPCTAGSKCTGGACLCNFATFPKQHTFRVFNGVNTCVNTAGLNGNFQALNFAFPTLPWYYMMTTSIGFWTNPAVYPSNQRAWVDEGLFIRSSSSVEYPLIDSEARFT